MSKDAKRITAKEKPVDNEKYAFRCFLLRPGFIGGEYKTDRKILLRNLSGSSAFKSGKAVCGGMISEYTDGYFGHDARYWYRIPDCQRTARKRAGEKLLRQKDSEAALIEWGETRTAFPISVFTRADYSLQRLEGKQG